MEMMPLDREDPTTLLEAALEGRVDILNRLIEQDPLILHKTSLTSMSETPLHVSSLMGHLDFTCAILNRHPKMASELDAYKRSPLHLASADGHAEIVQALLQANDSICLDRDEDGRIPLHLAAMRGRTEVIRKLISTKPESINMVLDGDTALHLCVRYNHLDALKIFVEMIDDNELINKGNKEGNTILHLATLLQHVETLKYLISEPKVGASTAVTVNKLGYTVFDILEHGPRDLKTIEIRRTLMKDSPVSKTQSDDHELGHIITNNACVPQQQQTATVPRKRTIAKLWFKKLMHWLDFQENWIKDMRGSLMIVATVIATISFQVAINPPGGVFQANYTDCRSDILSTYIKCRRKFRWCPFPGQAVLAILRTYLYNQLVLYNTVAFFASLGIILLIITGFPLQNKFFVWFLTMTMGIAVTSLAMTYLLSLQMGDSPDVHSHREDEQAHKLRLRSLLFWAGLLILVGAINTSRLLYWVGKKLTELLRKMLSKFPTKTEVIANGSRQEQRTSADV